MNRAADDGFLRGSILKGPLDTARALRRCSGQGSSIKNNNEENSGNGVLHNGCKGPIALLR